MGENSASKANLQKMVGEESSAEISLHDLVINESTTA